MMDKVSRSVFERLVQMDPSALTESDREFLKARKSYMTSEQRLKFTTFLDEVTPADAPVKPGTPQAEYNDIAAHLEAEAERNAGVGTLSGDHEKAIDQAMRSEKQRQAMTEAALKAEKEAAKEAEKAEKQRQKEADKAAKKAAKEAAK